MSNHQQYYKPTLIHEDPLPLEEKDIEYANDLLELSENNSGFIPVKLEQDVVVQRISHDLYAKPESGFRELYNNEVRACRTAQKHFNAEPRIVISLDPASRELEIQGFDSTGMSIDTFKNVYTVIGRSDNFSGEEIGQWGFGRVSYPTLSDIMVLETKYRTTDGKTGEYAIMGKNGVGYNILPKPNLEAFGTMVKLVLKKEVNLHRLLEYIEEACVFSGIPTYLDLRDDIQDESVTWRREVLRSKGCTKLNKSYEERAEEAARKRWYYSGDRGGKLIKAFKINTEGAELYGEIRVGEIENRAFPDVLRIGKDVRLIGSPIEARIDLPFSYFILNIQDERKYQPTTDRERLREESTEKLLQELKPKISEAISSCLGITSLEEFKDLDQGMAALLLSDRGARELEEPSCIALYISEDARRLRTLLLQEVKVYKDKETTRRYKKRILASVLRDKEPNEVFFTPFGERFNYGQIDRILQEKPGAAFIQLASSSRIQQNHYDAMEDFLREQGILSTSEYIEANREVLKRKVRRHDTSNPVNIFESIEGYYSWGRFSRATRHIEKVETNIAFPHNVIRVPKGSVRKYSSLLSCIKTTYKLVQDRPELKGGIKLQDFVGAVEEGEIETSKGNMPVKHLSQIAFSKGNIHLHLYSLSELGKLFCDSSESVRVFASEDSLFELAVYLTYHQVDFLLDTEMAELFDSEIKDSEREISRRNLLRDYSWNKLGDSEILGSVIHVFKEVSDDSLRFLFAKAVEGSKDRAEVAEMRDTMLRKWKRE